MASVVCAGVVTVDLVFGVPERVCEARKYRAGQSLLTSGGCALNAAMAIAKLGGQALLAGAVGDDLFADFLRRELAQEGVDAQLLRTVSGVPTARSAVLVTPDGERTIVNHRDERLFRCSAPSFEPFTFDAALCDTRWPGVAEQLLGAARRAARPAVLDAEPPLKHATEALAKATHVAFSEQGLSDYCAARTTEAALSEAEERLGSWVCVTRGAMPVLCHDGSRRYEVPAFDVKAVNTLGAGDAWHGAFALALAEGHEAAVAVRRANAVAALKVSVFGGRTSLPGRRRLEKFLEQYS